MIIIIYIRLFIGLFIFPKFLEKSFFIFILFGVVFIVKLVGQSIHFIFFLLSLEFIIITLIRLLILTSIRGLGFRFIFLFLTTIVIGACLGLGILVSLVRNKTLELEMAQVSL